MPSVAELLTVWLLWPVSVKVPPLVAMSPRDDNTSPRLAASCVAFIMLAAMPLVKPLAVSATWVVALGELMAEFRNKPLLAVMFKLTLVDEVLVMTPPT